MLNPLAPLSFIMLSAELSIAITSFRPFNVVSAQSKTAISFNRDACLCMGELQAPAAPHFVFFITL